MITDHEIFNIPDLRGQAKFELEVNWNKDDGTSNNCQVIKLRCPDGKEAYVKRDHLLAMLFAIGKPGDQMKMIPQKMTRVRRYETMVGVKANKDIAKGEMVNFRVSIPLPTIEDEVIGDVKKWAQEQSKQIIIH